MADTMIFLKLTLGDSSVVQGTSEVRDYKNWIEIETFNWSVKSHTPSVKQDAARQGSELTMENVTLEKSYDKASTLLCSGAAARQKVSSAVLVFADVSIDDGGQSTSKVFEMTMTDGFIEDLKISVAEGSKSITVKEELALSFREVKIAYAPVKVGDTARRAGITEFAYQMPKIA